MDSLVLCALIREVMHTFIVYHDDDDDHDDHDYDNDHDDEDRNSDEKTRVINEVLKSVTENLSASIMSMMINLIVMFVSRTVR